MSNLLEDDGSDEPDVLGVRLAQATAPAFVVMTRDYPHDERVEFVRAFLCCISGMCEQAVGHEATVEAYRLVAGLKPAGGADGCTSSSSTH